MKNDIMVSVVCMAYNHVNSIEQCLESMLCQKTNFKWEIIACDDASTDSGAEVLQEYVNKYPELIHAIYQSENQWSQCKIAKNSLFCRPMSVCRISTQHFDIDNIRSNQSFYNDYVLERISFYEREHGIRKAAKNGLILSRIQGCYKQIDPKYENQSLKEQRLKAQVLGRGFAWLDTGTANSLMDASIFVQTVQKRQGMVISAPEEIAYYRRWITREQLIQSADLYQNSPYGEHLHRVAEGKIIYTSKFKN